MACRRTAAGVRAPARALLTRRTSAPAGVNVPVRVRTAYLTLFRSAAGVSPPVRRRMMRFLGTPAGVMAPAYLVEMALTSTAAGVIAAVRIGLKHFAMAPAGVRAPAFGSDVRRTTVAAGVSAPETDCVWVVPPTLVYEKSSRRHTLLTSWVLTTRAPMPMPHLPADVMALSVVVHRSVPFWKSFFVALRIWKTSVSPAVRLESTSFRVVSVPDTFLPIFLSSASALRRVMPA